MTKSLKVALLMGASLLAIYAVLRAGFYCANAAYFEGIPLGDVLLAFLYALRFDVAGLILLNAPVLFLWIQPFPAIKPRWYKRITFGLFALLNTAGFILNIADLAYYPMVQRRLVFEPFASPGYFLGQFPGWFETFPVVVAGGLVLLGGLIYLLGRLARRFDRVILDTPGWIRGQVCGLLVIFLCIVGVRGGLQDVAMRPADAFLYSRHSAVGSLTLNSTYTVLVSRVLSQFEVVRKMPVEEARAIARAMVAVPGEEYGDPRYPFLRKPTPSGERRDLNVVILIQESWTWAHLGKDEKGVSRTPFFDGLARDGALFTNFLATGQRSSEAVPSILGSIPSLFRRPMIGSQYELGHLRGVGNLLGAHGYRCRFHHGGDRTSEGFPGFTGIVGFDEYYARSDFAATASEEETYDGKWGVYDHLFYLDAARKTGADGAPFVSVIFGLAPHEPYNLPPSRRAHYEQFTDDAPFQRGLRYSDDVLEQYFAYARQQPWFDKTVFLITADHTRMAPAGSVYETFHIPLLVYGPGIVKPQLRTDIGSHPDMLPTILDLLEVPEAHASLGRSLFAEGSERYAVVEHAGRYLLFTNERAYVHDMENEIGLYAYKSDRRFERDLRETEPKAAKALRRKLFAWVQTVGEVITEDRLWPGEGSLPDERGR
ncbi:MAG: sulfatase-like hydrolase/transferase [bacterium]|nr:sulfatase-like hydrolase/transferase [bacterium]